MQNNAAFKIYETYHAINLHFNTKYDYFKYHGKTNLKYDKFVSGKYNWICRKISSQHSLFDFKQQCITVVLDGQHHKSLDFGSVVCDINIAQTKERLNRIIHYSELCSEIKSKKFYIDEYLSGDISIEELYFNLIKSKEKITSIEGDLIEYNKLIKYEPFIKRYQTIRTKRE